MKPAIVPSSQGAAFSTVRWHLPGVTGERVRRVLDRAFATDTGGSTAPRTKLFIHGRLVDPAVEWFGRGRAARTDLFAWARAAQTHDPVLFHALVTGLEPWFAANGLPQGRVEAEVFFGRYRSTPGGIHREACSNLHLVVEGEKHMDFWSGGTWPPPGIRVEEDTDPESGAQEQYLSDLDPCDHLEDAKSLTAVPGQGFIWQAGVWHAGRSTGGPSLALNLAAYGWGLGQGPVLRPWAGRFAGEVPDEWLEDYRRHLAWSGGTGDLLATLSGLGMRSPKARFSKGRLPHRARHTAPVLWHRDRAGLWIAALGACTQVPDRLEIRGWLADGLCSGDYLDVPAVCRPIAGWLRDRGAMTVAERS